MHCAGAGHTAGEDLASPGDELAQLGSILVIDVLYFVSAELANLAAAANFAMRTLGSLVILFHLLFPPCSD
jgi:hypothetical protein